MHLFSLTKSDVTSKNGELSSECSETPHRSETPSLTLVFSSVLSAIHVKGGMDAQKPIPDSYRTLQMNHDTRNIPRYSTTHTRVSWIKQGTKLMKL